MMWVRKKIEKKKKKKKVSGRGGGGGGGRGFGFLFFWFLGEKKSTKKNTTLTSTMGG